MKTFIIYNKINDKSSINAKKCINSFQKYKGWNVQLFDGCNPQNIHKYDNKYNLSDNRSHITKDKPYFITKKACFYSHFELWQKCIDINESIVIVEHDVICKMNFPSVLNINHGVVQLTAESILSSSKTYQGKTFPQDYQRVVKQGNGIHNIEFTQKSNGYNCMASSTGYYITPSASKILVENCINFGWYQNDLLIRTEFFPLYYIVPEPIEYVETRELRSSTLWK